MNDSRLGRIVACSLLTILYTVTVIPAASFTSDDHDVTDYGSLFRYFPFSDSHRLYYAGRRSRRARSSTTSGSSVPPLRPAS